MATRDYTLGKGKVLFQPDGYASYVDLGNAPAFAVNVSIDKLEHFSSREGLSKKDLEVITRLGMGGSFTLDEPNAENLRMFVMSTGASSTTQAADAAPTIADIDLVDSTALGSWFPIYKTVSATVDIGAAVADDGNSGNVDLTTGGTPSGITATRNYTVVIDADSTPDTFMWKRDNGDWTFGVAITGAAQTLEDGVQVTFSDTATGSVNDKWTFTVTVTADGSDRVFNLDPANPPTVTDGADTLTEGVDGVGHYQIDYDAGLIYINPTQPTLYALDGSETIDFTGVQLLSGTKSASDGGTLSTLKGNLYFVGNPPQGRVIDILGYCSLTPNGDLSLIGEDWMQAQFNVEFLEVTGVDGLVRIEDRGKIG